MYSEGAIVAKSSLETVRVIKRTVDTIATENNDVTCQSCGVSSPAMVMTKNHELFDLAMSEGSTDF